MRFCEFVPGEKFGILIFHFVVGMLMQLLHNVLWSNTDYSFAIHNPLAKVAKVNYKHTQNISKLQCVYIYICEHIMRNYIVTHNMLCFINVCFDNTFVVNIFLWETCEH